MDELKRCPFCNEPPRLVPADITGATWVVACADCDIEGPFSDSRAGAVDAWNTRPADTIALADLATAHAEVERLRDALAWYADETNWNTQVEEVWIGEGACTAVARTALAATKENSNA